MSTQVARLSNDPDFPKDRTYESLVKNAEKYLDLSEMNVPKSDPLSESSIYFLRGFLLGSFVKPIKPKEIQGKYDSLAAVAYRKCLRIYPSNPQMMVMQGIWVGNSSDNAFFEKAAGVSLLYYASNIMNGVENRALTPYVNYDFITFWKRKNEKSLKEKLNEDIRKFSKSNS